MSVNPSNMERIDLKYIPIPVIPVISNIVDDREIIFCAFVREERRTVGKNTKYVDCRYESTFL